MDNPDIIPDIPGTVRPMTNEADTSAAAVSSIPTIVTAILRSICIFPNSTTLQDHSCTICLETFSTPGEEPIRLPCGHVFGSSCLVRWTQERLFRRCPMCRVQYLDPIKSLEVCKLHSTSDASSELIDKVIGEIRSFTNSEILEFDRSADEFYEYIGLQKWLDTERSENA